MKKNYINIDSVAYNKMTNLKIKWTVEDLLKHLKPLSVAVDKKYKKKIV